MKKLFSIIICILSANCSHKNSSVSDTHVRILRAVDSSFMQVTDKDQLDMNDYMVFENGKNKNFSVADAAKSGPYKISSVAECLVKNETRKITTQHSQSALQIKSLLPYEFFLSDNKASSCNLKVTLEMNGST